MPIQSTLDAEIETLKQAIAAECKHISRQEYIEKVQPMKDELVVLIEQNKVIKAANNIIINSPTSEELAAQVEDERKLKCKNDIELIYPDLSDEVKIIRTVLAMEFPDNELAKEYNDNIELILSKHSKEV